MRRWQEMKRVEDEFWRGVVLCEWCYGWMAWLSPVTSRRKWLSPGLYADILVALNPRNAAKRACSKMNEVGGTRYMVIYVCTVKTGHRSDARDWRRCWHL